MMKSILLPLLFLGTIFLVVAEEQDAKLAEVVEREERLESVVEKLVDFIESKGKEKTEAPIIDGAKTEGTKTDGEKIDEAKTDKEKNDGEAKDIKADAAAKDQDEDLEKIEDDISPNDMGEDEDEVEDEVKAELVNKQEKSDAKPWGRRRRRDSRRRITVRIPLGVLRVPVRFRLPRIRWRFRRWGKK